MNKIIRLLHWNWLRLHGNSSYKNNGIWVFGEWFGKRCCDNSMYLANYIAEEHPEIQCVWVAEEGADLSSLHRSIRVLEMDKPETLEIISNASVVVMNQGLVDLTKNKDFFLSGPVTLNLWHGVPWKKIGLDGAPKSAWIKGLYYKVQVSLLASRYYLSLSDVFSGILVSACGAKKDGIIKAGYPRNSVFYDRTNILSLREKLIASFNLKEKFNCENLKIITYMPTFRDSGSENFSFTEIQNDDSLNEVLNRYNAIIIQKSHFAANNKGSAINNPRIFTADQYPAQELLAASDILITDYSSCFFDFLVLDRPIIHFVYDYQYYSTKDRGLYYTKEAVACGDTPATTEDLIKSIECNLQDPGKDAQLRKARKEQYIPYESADSCKKIYEYLINHRS